ncbi:MAG: hypothetical protein ACREX5_01465 [Achromobacter pestifer]
MLRSLIRSPRSLFGALALTILSQTSPTAHAAERVVYSGTLQGAGDVVMELDSQPGKDGAVQGRYFHAKNGVDIPLSGTDKALVEPKPLWESQQAQQAAGAKASATAATWQGVRDADGFRGLWIDANTGKQHRFDLRRVAQYDAPPANGNSANADINAQQAPYDTLKLAGHAAPVGQDIGNAHVAYRMWRDPRTKFSYPRLSRHPDAQVLQRVNHLLEQRHWKKSLGALACMAAAYTRGGPETGTLGNYDEEVITVTWLSRALMTVTEAGSLDCGGAHPYNHFEPYTYDLLRGENLNWNLIFDAYDDSKPRTPKASPILAQLAEQAREQFTASNAADSGKRPNLEDCADLWPDYLVVGATKPGALSLSVSGVGHASGACLGTHAQVPFKDLAPYLKPGGQAYLVSE